MAEVVAKAPKAAVAAPAPETEKVGEFTLVHKGHGKYAIEGQGKEFRSREDALSYLTDLEASAKYENEFGDIIPEGIEIRPRRLEYGGTLLDLPMNHHYLPEGGHSPYYDRAWNWGWARATGPDVSSRQAMGYRLVSRDELEALTAEGQVPEHYLSLLMSVELGSRMQYGDLVLMRCPRVLWRQYHAELEASALRQVQKLDDKQAEVFERAGVRHTATPIQNELTSGLKVSGF